MLTLRGHFSQDAFTLYSVLNQRRHSQRNDVFFFDILVELISKLRFSFINLPIYKCTDLTRNCEIGNKMRKILKKNIWRQMQRSKRCCHCCTQRPTIFSSYLRKRSKYTISESIYVKERYRTNNILCKDE